MFNQYRSFLMTTTETNENVSETFSQMPMAKKIREVLLGVVTWALFLGFAFLLFYAPWIILKSPVSETEIHFTMPAMMSLLFMVFGFIYFGIVCSISKTSKYLSEFLLLFGSMVILQGALATSYVLREYPFFEVYHNTQNTVVAIMIGVVALFCFFGNLVFTNRLFQRLLVHRIK